MSVWDWLIVAGFLVGLCGVAWGVGRASQSVTDFMAAGRCAGRYLLSMANDMGGFAAIFVVATFEQFYVSGFPGAWWSVMMMPMWAVIMATGWIQYRFRETRALTMPHFFALRYSPRLRVFAGVLAFGAGVLNYGIFPGVTADLLVSFCDLPSSVAVAGWSVPTRLPVMLAVMGVAMAVLLRGGLVSVMLTDFAQGLLVMFGTIAIALFLIFHLGWGTIFDGVMQAEAGRSKVDPFDQGEVASFNFWFFLILAMNRFYAFMAFPTRQGYDAAAFSPNEARFSRMLGDWLFNVRTFVLMLLPIGAWVLMHSAGFEAQRAAVESSLAGLADDQTRTQMTVPVILAQVLPVGFMGLFIAMMLGAAVSTDNTFVHSWGSIFVHDVVEPMRRAPLGEATKLRLLRAASFGVAGFAVVWSMVFPVKEYIFMYFQITSSIYVAGAGIAVIGGLYWSRGTTAGAWWAFGVGMTLSLGGIVLRLVWPSLPLPEGWPGAFPINGVWVFFIAMATAVLTYVVVSLITCRRPHDMEAMLHRRAADAGPGSTAEEASAAARFSALNLRRLRGVDRWTAAGYLGFVVVVVGLFLLGNVARLVVELPDALWRGYWQVFVAVMLVVAVAMAGWFLVGGLGDIRRLRRALQDAADDPPADPEAGQNASPAPSPEAAHADRPGPT